MCMSAVTYRVQNRQLDPLELELWATISCLTWVLGTTVGSSAIAAHTANMSQPEARLVIYLSTYLCNCVQSAVVVLSMAHGHQNNL